MIISVDDNNYEVSNEHFNEIYEDAKQFTMNVLDYCEDKKCNNRDLLLYLMSVNSHIETIVYNKIQKDGEENFMKMVGAKKI